MAGAAWGAGAGGQAGQKCCCPLALPGPAPGGGGHRRGSRTQDPGPVRARWSLQGEDTGCGWRVRAREEPLGPLGGNRAAGSPESCGWAAGRPACGVGKDMSASWGCSGGRVWAARRGRPSNGVAPGLSASVVGAGSAQSPPEWPEVATSQGPGQGPSWWHTGPFLSSFHRFSLGEEGTVGSEGAPTPAGSPRPAGPSRGCGLTQSSRGRSRGVPEGRESPWHPARPEGGLLAGVAFTGGQPSPPYPPSLQGLGRWRKSVGGCGRWGWHPGTEA